MASITAPLLAHHSRLVLCALLVKRVVCSVAQTHAVLCGPNTHSALCFKHTQCSVAQTLAVLCGPNARSAL